MAHKILIVDDEQEIALLVQKKLIQHGYAAAVAANGEEALAKVKEYDPDIILLDLTMPGMNGYEVLQAVRQNFKDKWRPIIIVSAQIELDAVKKCYALEADHYLTKPCPIESILRGIETMISLIPQRINDKNQSAALN